MTTTTTIRPGWLVAVRTTVRGGVFYDREDLPAEQEGQSKWLTTKTITDREELAAAEEARGRARSLIVGCVARTSFCYLCSFENEDLLDQRIAEAHALADAVNKKHKHCRLQVHVVKGRLEPSDTQAARAVAADIAQLISNMDQGIRKADPKSIRAAANQATQMLSILTADKQKQAGIAIEEARKAARRIVARVEKQGEKLAVALEDVNMRKISRARMAFLDLSEPEVPAPAGKRAPGVEVRRMAAVGEVGEEE